MRVIGIESSGAGTNNQIRGVILEGAEKGEKIPVTRDDLLKAPDGTLLHSANYSSAKEYREAITQTVDNFCAQLKQNKEQAPDFVVLPYDQSKGTMEVLGLEVLSSELKKSFAKQGIAVKTMVIASALHDYENIDLIHVGKHQLSDEDEAKLAQDAKLRAKVVATEGVPSNLSKVRIGQEANSPLKKQELEQYRGKKNALISLGGKTDNGAIQFTLEDAHNLINYAKRLSLKGYNVIFTNSPRTPNDVTDYLYEKCHSLHMNFYNSKKIAQNTEDAANFRIYDGKYKEEFAQQAEKIGGNIYPAVLDVCDFVVNTHDSFSYTSDAAALGITSVVYTGNQIDFARRPDCKKLFEQCEKAGYVISFDTAIHTLDQYEELKTKPMLGVSAQLVKAMKEKIAKERIHQKQKAEFVQAAR